MQALWSRTATVCTIGIPCSKLARVTPALPTKLNQGSLWGEVLSHTLLQCHTLSQCHNVTYYHTMSHIITHCGKVLEV